MSIRLGTWGRPTAAPDEARPAHPVAAAGMMTGLIPVAAAASAAAGTRVGGGDPDEWAVRLLPGYSACLGQIPMFVRLALPAPTR